MSQLSTTSLGALNATATEPVLEGYGTLAITVSGTWVGTLTVQGSDGTNTVSLLTTNMATGALSSTTSANGYYVVSVPGTKSLTVKMTAYSSGSATVAFQTAGPSYLVTSLDHLLGGTDSTQIGNISDRLKVDAVLNATSDFPNINRTDVASAARIVSGNSGTLDTQGMGCQNFQITITASSGTNPTLDLFLEVSDDGSTWTAFIQSKRFTGTGNQRFQGLRNSAKYYRYSWVIAGTTPSFTFSISTTLKAYLSRRFTNKIQYAFDLTQATGSVTETFTAADSPNVSLVTIRGTDGGSNAAYRVQVSNDDVTYVDITGNIAQGSNSQNVSTYTGAYRFYRLNLNVNANAGTRVMDIHWAANG